MNLTDLTQEEIDALFRSPRQCTKCKRNLLGRDFPTTTERGRKVMRTWCNGCCLNYYRAYYQRRRETAFEAIKRQAAVLSPGV